MTRAPQDLPKVTVDVARRLKLMSLKQLAEHFDAEASTISRRLNAGGEGIPGPVAVLVGETGGRAPRLYSLKQFAAWVDRLPENRPMGIKKRSYKVQLVGTKTPTAGRPYVWRDSARWKSQETL